MNYYAEMDEFMRWLDDYQTYGWLQAWINQGCPLDMIDKGDEEPYREGPADSKVSPAGSAE